MRQISNSDMRTLLRHLPRVLPAVNTGGDNRIYESSRLLYRLVRKLERAERERTRKGHRKTRED